MQKVQENCCSLPKKALTWLTNMNSAYHEPSWRHKTNCNAQVGTTTENFGDIQESKRQQQVTPNSSRQRNVC